jgi:hypothetical protein
MIFLRSLATTHGFGTEHEDNLAKTFRSFDAKGKGRKLWMARYNNARASCAWEQDVEALEYDYDWFPTDAFMKDNYWSYLVSQMLITTYYPEIPRWLVRLLHNFFGPGPHGPSLQSYNCRATDSEGAELRIRRLGPFVSNGGLDWHKMKLQDPFNLRQSVQQGGIHVTGFAAMPVAENGAVLGNPPIHIHHANLGPNTNRSSLSRLSQWHGDSQCAGSDGGTACYVTALPPGYSFPVSDALRLDIDFNDVRPPQSPNLTFWLEASISIAKPAAEDRIARDVGTVILGVPFRGHWWKSSDLQRLYFVPADQPSALWVTGRMPAAGTFVAGGKIEIHQHMLDEAWVFTGVSPEDLGLNSDAWQLQKPWLPWIPRDNGMANSTAAIKQLKARVLEHFERAKSHCNEDPPCAKPPTLMWKLDRTVFEDGEERQMPWPRNTWTFEKGEQFTTVIFHRAIAMHAHGHPAEMPQHLAITGYYVPTAGTRADYWFVMPSSNADWAWLNSVNWSQALLHYGGPPVGVWSWPLAIFAFMFMAVTYMVALCTGKKRVEALKSCYSQFEMKHGKVQTQRCHGSRKYSAIGRQNELCEEAEEKQGLQIQETTPVIQDLKLHAEELA